MIAEQLQVARSAHWRQQHNPLLTLEDAQTWLGQHPLCLYLPRRAQLPAPAPSFVEACLGSAQTTPGAVAIEQAQALLTRLTASGAVVPLNLLGAVGEQPDFLATAEALPFVLSLRADADWKHAPQKSSGHKVSPLVLELWKLLEQQGALTAEEAREALGRELTEAAVLRALAELWQGLRISPVYGEEGKPARWEMMRVRHREALGTAGATGQVTAISLLVSMYLQSVYAATSEEIEIFLSPVTSRSRVREAVRGLSATRQIHSLSMEAQTYYFLENGLPEFATVAVSDAVEVPPAPLAVRPKRREHPLTPPPGEAVTAPAARPVRPERKAPAAARAGWKSPQRAVSPGRPIQPSQGGEGNSWPPKKTADPSTPLRSRRDDKGRAARPAGFARAEATPRPASAEGRPPFKPRSGPPRSGPPRQGGFARAGAAPRPGGEGRPPFKPRSGPPRSGPPRQGGFARAGAAPRTGGEGKPPFKPRSGPPRSGPPRSGGFARTGASPRPGGEGKPPFKPRSGPPRTGGYARTGATPRPSGSEGRPPFKPRSGPPRSGPPRSGGFARTGAPPRSTGEGRPPFKPRSGPPRSGPPRSGGFARTGAPPRPGGEGRPPFKPRSGPPRSGPPRSGGFARTGAPPRPGGEGRPPFKPRSGPPRSGPPRSGPPRAGGSARTGAPPRSTGEGKPPFKPRSGPPKGGPRAGGARPGRAPGDYPRRKPDRKKPGA